MRSQGCLCLAGLQVRSNQTKYLMLTLHHPRRHAARPMPDMLHSANVTMLKSLLCKCDGNCAAGNRLQQQRARYARRTQAEHAAHAEACRRNRSARSEAGRAAHASDMAARRAGPSLNDSMTQDPSGSQAADSDTQTVPQRRQRAAALSAGDDGDDRGHKRVRTAASHSAQFMRMQPARTIAPVSIDPSTGRVYRCRWCNSPLFQSEAAPERQTMCCRNGRDAHLTPASLMPPPSIRALMRDGRWPRLSRQVNSACSFANICVARGLNDGGRGFHTPATAQPKTLRLEGKVMYFYQRASDTASTCAAAIKSLIQASKSWWTVARSDAAMPATADADLRDLTAQMRRELKQHHQRCEELECADSGSESGDDASQAELRLEFQHQPQATEVMAVHTTDEADYEGPPAPQYTRRDGKPLPPGELDSAAFPALWQKQPYSADMRGTGEGKLTRRKWLKRVMMMQLPQLTRSPGLAQEYLLSVWSEIEEFALQGVREQMKRWKKNNCEHVRNSDNPEAAAGTMDSMPTTYVGTYVVPSLKYGNTACLKRFFLFLCNPCMLTLLPSHVCSV